MYLTLKYLKNNIDLKHKPKVAHVGLGGLGVMPRDPSFVGSNPAEVDGFFQDVKILEI